MPVLAALVLAVVTHVALTRSRPGWHVLAVGGSRRSAHNAGIRVRRTVFMTYVFSGALLRHRRLPLRHAAVGRRARAPAQGLEIMALTAAVVGGNSLGGGRGSVAKGVMGAIIVLVMTNGLIRLGYGTGTNQMVLGILLAVAVTIDIRWLKNRHKVLNEVYVAPVYLRMGEAQSAVPGSGTPYELNNRLSRGRGHRARRARRARRTSSSTATTISIAAPATARSSASSRPTTSGRRSSPISAASRSGWPSTATATC